MMLRAKKSLGQNFLKSHRAIRSMITASQIVEGDVVIEIGPGKGALTKPLLEAGARVIAFELDERMITFLKDELSEFVASGQLTLVHQDIIEGDIENYTRGHPYKVVANIPYYITNLIIRNFLSRREQPTDMCLLVQKEVAERIIARDGKESILSLSVKFYGKPSYVMKVSRQYFSPSPKVDSAIILISDIFREGIPDLAFEKTFFEMVKLAFSQKRKRAIKNLQKIAKREIWEKIFSEHNIDVNARAEDIVLQGWLDMTSAYIREREHK